MWKQSKLQGVRESQRQSLQFRDDVKNRPDRTRSADMSRSTSALSTPILSAMSWAGIPARNAARMILFLESMASSNACCLAATVFTALDRSPRIRSEEHTSELQSRGHLVCR